MAEKRQCESCGGKLVSRPDGSFECDGCGRVYPAGQVKAAEYTRQERKAALEHAVKERHELRRAEWESRKEEVVRKAAAERTEREQKAAKARALEERLQKREKLTEEKNALQTELARSRSLFTGKHKKELEARIADIEAELKKPD